MTKKLYRMSNICKVCGILYFLDFDELDGIDVGLCPKCKEELGKEFEKEERILGNKNI